MRKTNNGSLSTGSISKVRFKKPNHSKSDLENYETYLDYYFRLKGIALSTFEWLNLPESVNEIFLEEALYEDGFSLFFKDDDMRNQLFSKDESVFLSLRGIIGQHLNVYNIPMIRTAYAVNGYRKELTEKDSVIIYDNVQKQNIDNTIMLYAKRLAEVERIMDVNLKQQKVPTVIITSEAGKESMRQFYNKVDGNEPLIMVDESFDIDNYKILKTEVPFQLDKLIDYKHALWNECMTWLGIGNANNDKRERLIVSEVEVTADQKDIMKDVRLIARKRAIKEIVKIFPELEGIDVRFRLDREEDIPEEIDENEDIQDNSEENLPTLKDKLFGKKKKEVD